MKKTEKFRFLKAVETFDQTNKLLDDYLATEKSTEKSPKI